MKLGEYPAKSLLPGDITDVGEVVMSIGMVPHAGHRLPPMEYAGSEYAVRVYYRLSDGGWMIKHYMGNDPVVVTG